MYYQPRSEDEWHRSINYGYTVYTERARGGWHSNVDPKYAVYTFCAEDEYFSSSYSSFHSPVDEAFAFKMPFREADYTWRGRRRCQAPCKRAEEKLDYEYTTETISDHNRSQENLSIHGTFYSTPTNSKEKQVKDNTGKVHIADTTSETVSIYKGQKYSLPQEKSCSHSTSNHIPCKGSQTEHSTPQADFEKSSPFNRETPVSDTHNYMLFCSRCYPPEFVPLHDCARNILAFVEKGTSDWYLVREYVGLQGLPRQMSLCSSQTSSGTHTCNREEDTCNYAHNMVELRMWLAESKGFFNTQLFIQLHKKRKWGIRDIVLKYGKSFDLICKLCLDRSEYFGQNPNDPSSCNGSDPHCWSSSKILRNITDGFTTMIRRPFFTGEDAFYKLCYSTPVCRRQHCTFAHSFLERDIWMLERDQNISPDELVELCKSANLMSDQDMFFGGMKKGHSPCPYELLEYCSVCYKSGHRKTHPECGHTKLVGSVYITRPGQKKVNPLPSKIPKYFNFSICRNMKNGKCTYTGAVRCNFAHSHEEITVWTWMCNNAVNDLADINNLADNSEVPDQQDFTESPLVSLSQYVPIPHYCQICNVQCNGDTRWKEHCTSERHLLIVSSDKEQQWNYRDPLWNHVDNNDLKICQRHLKGAGCCYSFLPDMYNLCVDAHLPEELEEWKKRMAWREMVTNMERYSILKPYVHKLQNHSYVMSKDHSNVEIEVSNTEIVTDLRKYKKFTWVITLRSSKHTLKNVVLLHNKDRLYFSMEGSNSGNGELQAAPSSYFKIKDNEWVVIVNFIGNTYGSFSQRVVLDFGTHTLLYRQFYVELGTKKGLRCIQAFRKKMVFKLWTIDNKEIISSSSYRSAKYRDLLQKYPMPSDVNSAITQDIINTDLNRNNYIRKMHKLLYLEEFTCNNIISSYNVPTEMAVTLTIQEEGSLIKADDGSLYGKVHLADELSYDTDAGYLVLTSCATVLVASTVDSSHRVYEVEIVQDRKVTGYKRNCIYLHLPCQLVRDLELVDGTTKVVEIQFQLNRLTFCRMHMALDSLQSTDIVFPDLAKYHLLQESRLSECSSAFLNEHQLVALRHILTERPNYVPPFILNGPFGTGKTETLAQAVMALLERQSKARILICTQSNSAADTFITKYLDTYLCERDNKDLLLRIYSREASVATVSPQIRNYCLSDDTNFRSPTKKDLVDVQIAITTLETSACLVGLDLRGHFSHIFIDEADQVLECMTLLPLSMATETTCVVLAGDNCQIKPKVYSAVGRQQKMSTSVIERLYNYYRNYPKQHVNVDRPLYTQLKRNYRNTMEIACFLSNCFYDDTAKLTSDLKIPGTDFKVLQFCPVKGSEKHYPNGVSSYNLKEVNEVYGLVKKLVVDWPDQWGELNYKDIAVISTYTDQINLFQQCFQKSQMRSVTVENIANVSGNEYKVVVISTVCTYHSLYSHMDGKKVVQTGNMSLLSNKRLLHTAMTRAKYAVIVVGDEAILSAYGECKSIWRACFENYK